MFDHLAKPEPRPTSDEVTQKFPIDIRDFKVQNMLFNEDHWRDEAALIEILGSKYVACDSKQGAHRSWEDENSQKLGRTLKGA